MKNILFLTDFSEPSKHAIDYVCAILLEYKKEYNFHILHVSKASSSFTLANLTSSNSVYSSVIGNYKEKLAILKSNLEKTYTIPFTTSIGYDNFTNAIENHVSKHNIDTIITGFDGANSLPEKVFGSNTLQLIRSIRVNTFIIPQKTPIKKPNTILCLLDEKDDLRTILKHDIIQNNLVKIVRVINNDNYTIAVKDEFILNEFKNINATHQLISNIPMHYVKSYMMQTTNIDLTMLLVQKTSVLERLFIDNTTTQINQQLIKPIFITHQQN